MSDVKVNLTMVLSSETELSDVGEASYKEELVELLEDAINSYPGHAVSKIRVVSLSEVKEEYSDEDEDYVLDDEDEDEDDGERDYSYYEDGDDD